MNQFGALVSDVGIAREASPMEKELLNLLNQLDRLEDVSSRLVKTVTLSKPQPDKNMHPVPAANPAVIGDYISLAVLVAEKVAVQLEELNAGLRSNLGDIKILG